MTAIYPGFFTAIPGLYQGDCLDILAVMPENSVDSIVTDPPYGLKFMGKRWDHNVPSVAIWAQCLRVLKPGGHLLSFAGTRTHHRMAVNIEDAGFEIRDMIAWVYGSGFPKSLDVSKAMDKAVGAKREVVGTKLGQPGYSLQPNDTSDHERRAYGQFTSPEAEVAITAPATDQAKQWDGWGTALKPALEPICVARKPLIGTVAANVLKFGTGGLNIGDCRVGESFTSTGGYNFDAWRDGEGREDRPNHHNKRTTSQPNGRWPANLIHDGSQEVTNLFPNSKGQQGDVKGTEKSTTGDENTSTYGKYSRVAFSKRDDSGSAARFFYCAKASKADRNEGLDQLPPTILARSDQAQAEAQRSNTVKTSGGAYNKARIVKNNHPTVKPTDLMRYLCRLVTPPNGLVLDPFMGSGSTGKAAALEGFQFIGIELDAQYIEISQARIAVVQ